MKLTNIFPLFLSLRRAFLFFCVFLIILAQVIPQRAYAFSVGDEKEIGEKLLSMVRKQFDLVDELDVHQYVNTLGSEVLAVAGNQFFDYHFFTIKNNDFNAFAAPSGLIFLHSGLIEAMEDEGELISVIAHECGHVKSRHLADRISKTTKTSIATAALLIAGIVIGGGPISEALISGSAAAGTSLNLKFSRQDEEEADRLAFKWMKEMGTNPTSMSSMLRKMHKISIYHVASIPPYLLTHPEPKRRMSYVQDLLFIYPDANNLPQRDNFNFQRIKSRILSLTHKPSQLHLISNRQLEKAKTEQEAVMAHYGLYLANLGEADFQKAEKELEQVISAYGEKPILLTDKGIIYYKKGAYGNALNFFEEAHQKDPTCAFTMYYLANTLQQQQQNQKALNVYEDLLGQVPESPKAHYQIGQIKTQQGQKGAGHYHLGLYFWYEGDYQMATLHLQEATESEDTPEPLKQKARELKKKIQQVKKS